MLTFTDTPVSKPQLIASLEAHAAADHIRSGHYWENGTGCSVGCSLVDFGVDPSSHIEFERQFGIPVTLARLNDAIFEGLKDDEQKAWPLRFANAVPVGKDLSLVGVRFTIWVLADPEHGCIKYCRDDGKAATETVVSLLERVLQGDKPSEEEWSAAARAAARAAAAAAAAYAAARAAADAAYAAYAAADAARAAARAAAAAAATYAAARAAARAAAAAAYARMADKLIALIGEAA